MTSHELQDLCNRFAKQKKISPKQIWTSFISNFAIDSAKNDSETKIIVHDREYLKRIFLLISSISDADLSKQLFRIEKTNINSYLITFYSNLSVVDDREAEHSLLNRAFAKTA